MSLNQYIRPVRTKLLHISCIRNISITQSSINTTIKNDESISKTTTIPENIQQAKELAGYRALEIPEFKTLGSAEGTTATGSSSSSSSSILSINVPPSVPVYIRRGSLLLIYGIQEISSIDSVRSQLQFPNFWKRLIYGGYVSGYQKLISTTPFSLLISSKSRSSGSGGGSGSGSGSGFEKLFVNLVLDGTTDWAILDKSALQVYTGNSLSITMHKLPKFISKKLSRSLKKDKKSKTNTNKLETGLFSWKKLGYTLLSGRGKVGLVGNGSSSGYGSSIYNINLNQNEEILINKNNLLGITVNGPYDLQNCIVKYEFPIINNANPTNTNTNINIKEPVTIVKPKLIQPTTWNLIVLKLKNFNNGFKKFFQIINKYTLGLKTTSYNYLAGNQDFIKVIGPRNLLLQSNTNKSHRGFNNIIPRNKPQAKVWPTNQTTTKVDESSSFSTPKDYLNYVTIEPGKGAVFKSTLDFSETVESIENKNKNKNKSK